jgi:ABC-2 type transport system permease protein
MSEAAMILLLLVDNISAYTFFGSIPVLSSLLQWLSNQQKFIVFSNGYMQISDLFAYITEIAVFLILTVISVEKRRWSRR